MTLFLRTDDDEYSPYFESDLARINPRSSAQLASSISWVDGFFPVAGWGRAYLQLHLCVGA